MEDYRSYHATPDQISSLWFVIGSMRQQIEELTERLGRMELAEAGSAARTVLDGGEAVEPTVGV